MINFRAKLIKQFLLSIHLNKNSWSIKMLKCNKIAQIRSTPNGYRLYIELSELISKGSSKGLVASKLNIEKTDMNSFAFLIGT